jgi:hypothetical protein
MSLQEINALHIIHVFGVIGLVASTFYACAGEPGTRKKTMMANGIASLLVLLTGIRMWQGLYHFQGVWVIVKLVCWLVLSGLGGAAYRRREKTPLWITLSLAAVLIALVMVYTQPF